MAHYLRLLIGYYLGTGLCFNAIGRIERKVKNPAVHEGVMEDVALQLAAARARGKHLGVHEGVMEDVALQLDGGAGAGASSPVHEGVMEDVALQPWLRGDYPDHAARFMSELWKMSHFNHDIGGAGLSG